MRRSPQQGEASLPVLDARDVRLARSTGTSDFAVDLTLRQGDLCQVLCRDPAVSRDLVDGLLGLVAPRFGEIGFFGNDWQKMSDPEAAEQRRLIARVQAAGNWIETRSVMDNVLLPSAHHTIVPIEQLRETAGAMAQRYGLPGLPLGLPGQCAAVDLEAAACVRAFLGRPALVVLEDPLAFEDSAVVAPLMHSIQQLRRRGGAALWITAHRGLFADPGIAADLRLRVVGGRLVDVDRQVARTVGKA